MSDGTVASWMVRFEDRPTYEPGGHAGVVNRSLAGRDVLGTESVSIWHGTMSTGGHAEPHVHEHSDQFYVVLKGEVEVGVGDEVQTLPQLATAYMAAGSRHWIRNNREEPAEVLVISSPALR